MSDDDTPTPRPAVWHTHRTGEWREVCHGCGADAPTLYDAGKEGVLLCVDCRRHPRDYWTKERRP